MYAIATFSALLLFGGPIAGQRDPAAGDRWISAPTQAECEAKVIAALQELASDLGDELVWAQATCERVGA